MANAPYCINCKFFYDIGKEKAGDSLFGYRYFCGRPKPSVVDIDIVLGPQTTYPKDRSCHEERLSTIKADLCGSSGKYFVLNSERLI